MKDPTPQTVYLSQYKVSDFLIRKTKLTFDLGEQITSVKTELFI